MVSEGRKIRVLFSKTGALKFISHLDLNRTMKAAFLRAQLPIRYTLGFNPHPKMVFSAPLSVGTSGLCEFMDFKITDEAMTGEEICAALNAAFPAGLHALEAYEPTSKLCDIRYAEYEIVMEAPRAKESVSEEIRALFRSPMIAEKTGKSGPYTVDIAPLCEIRSLSLAGGRLTLRLLLSASENEFVNPKLPLDFLCNHIESLEKDPDYTICRTAVFLADKETPFR